MAHKAELDDVTRSVLRLLVLDVENTAVTAEVAEAVLLRGDLDGTRVVVRALAEAEELTADWIDSAAINATQDAGQWSTLQKHLTTIVREQEPAVEAAAQRLLAYIGAPGRDSGATQE